MGEALRNHEAKASVLKDVIRDIHDRGDFVAAKRKFDSLIRNVSPEEIAGLEQSLIEEGVPVEQVQRLCEVHVDVFERALKNQKPGKVLPGHPVDTYKRENRELRKRIRGVLRSAGKSMAKFQAAFEDLKMVELHYSRKENQLFPFLETVGFTGPSKVMWGKHDEIRSMIKGLDQALHQSQVESRKPKVRELARAMRRMIFMEERILFPTALRKLPPKAWVEIRRGESEIGYAWTKPGNLWDANVVTSRKMASTLEAVANADKPAVAGEIPLNVGALLPMQIDLLLRNLPVDVTFVDEDDRVRYYSQGKERIFPRSPGIIGRNVANCHPPKSVHVVEEILRSFRAKERKDAEFWLEVMGKFIHIRYFPLFDEKGEYRGVLEVSQDVTHIRKLEGEKRLL